MTAAVAVGADFESIQWAIENYEPLPHRLQFVGEVAGRRFYNDSLATTPESTEVALQAFKGPIVLLAGGYDKHVDLTAMAASDRRPGQSGRIDGPDGDDAAQDNHSARREPLCRFGFSTVVKSGFRLGDRAFGPWRRDPALTRLRELRLVSQLFGSRCAVRGTGSSIRTKFETIVGTH